ncbi:MAG TPA: radical SAM protein [Thermoplasmata archaeon]|nr:radical SAM protein [Thermoplasmata archaeon]
MPTAAPPGPSPEDRPARLLLVDPYVAREDPMERKFVELYPSLSLLTLAAYLRRSGTVVRICDLTFARDARPVDDAIRQFHPDVVGVHTKSLTLPRALEVAQGARAAGVVTVAGGPDSATRPEVYLDGGFDAVVVAEGELTLEELLSCVLGDRPLAGLAGVVARSGDRTVRGPHRPYLADLDALPLPAWELIDMEAYLGHWQRRTGERRAALLTSRGCPFDCSWCSKPTFGRTFRQQSPERVLAELEALRTRYRVDYVRFCDDVFGIQRRWLETLLDGMISRDLRLQFECLARVDLLKTDLLDQMRRAGLARVYLGVESGSQKMLDLMNRGTKLAQISRVAAELKAHHVRQFWFLMLGYPGETVEDVEATLKLFRKFSPEEYSVSIAVPVPGTRLYDLVKERLTGRVRGRPKRGGESLLFEAAYPESLYRWEQARFAWEAQLQKLRGRISDRVLEELTHTGDRFHERIAAPLLLGQASKATPDPRRRDRKFSLLPGSRPPSRPAP